MIAFIIWTIKTVIYSAVFLLLCGIAFIPAYWVMGVVYVHYSQNMLVYGAAGFTAWLVTLAVGCSVFGIK